MADIDEALRGWRLCWLRQFARYNAAYQYHGELIEQWNEAIERKERAQNMDPSFMWDAEQACHNELARFDDLMGVYQEITGRTGHVRLCYPHGLEHLCPDAASTLATMRPIEDHPT